MLNFNFFSIINLFHFLWVCINSEKKLIEISTECKLFIISSNVFTIVSPSSLSVIPTVQFSSVAHLCPSLCDPMDHSTPGSPVHHQLLKSTQTHFHWVRDAIQPSHPLSSPSSLAFNISQHQCLLERISSCIKWPKYWSFSFSISLSNEYSGLISFRIDWLDFLAVQGTLKSLLQHHSSKYQFFGTQLSL